MSKGFSLVEILLAISLISLVTAVAIPNLRDYNKNRELTDASAQFVNILRTAQSSATSGIKCPSGVASTSWQVNITVNSNGADSYSLVANCQDTAPNNVQTVYTNSFSTGQAGGISFQVTTDCTTANKSVNIFFRGKQVAYRCSGASVDSTTSNITITMADSSLTKNIVVEPGGVIRVD